MKTIPSVQRTFHVSRAEHGERRIRPGVAPPRPTLGRLPRLTRIMALAIHFDRVLLSGRFASQADLARAGQVTRARLTQILNLTTLAPDIQEQILHLAAYSKGRAPLTERHVRHIAAEPNWDKQRKLFDKVMDRIGRNDPA
ncbi:hypothetical protein Q31b_37440 [Novipirellula aureliae]|uniref:Uncharacterized protein n=1 Tax=Novipirellula aureliae TaxID=2527966 RepID=A0A5C6DUF0_9BACT|nr:hypothetical protein [Novipirellula aureliae]TWU38666.1 hypothetical protein Q31b_37440 [Novipirellula aureliae]